MRYVAELLPSTSPIHAAVRDEKDRARGMARIAHVSTPVPSSVILAIYEVVDTAGPRRSICFATKSIAEGLADLLNATDQSKEKVA